MRIGADRRPLRAERDTPEIEREVVRVQVATGSRDPPSRTAKQVERVVRGDFRGARRIHAALEAKVRKRRVDDPSMTVSELLAPWLDLCRRVGKLTPRRHRRRLERVRSP